MMDIMYRIEQLCLVACHQGSLVQKVVRGVVSVELSGSCFLL